MQQLELIDELFDKFESELSKSHGPRIEDFLNQMADLPEVARHDSLVGMIILELDYDITDEPLPGAESNRTKLLEKASDYLKRFPVLGQGVVPFNRFWTHFYLRAQMQDPGIEPGIILRYLRLDDESIANCLVPVSTRNVEQTSFNAVFQQEKNRLDTEAYDSELYIRRLLTGDQVDFPVQFGDYEILEKLGHGGMGIVFKARQLSLNRLVALKMIRSGVFASQEEINRFRIDANAAAKLEHPNLVSIYEFGTFEGHYFFAMQYIEGADLASFLGKSSRGTGSTDKHPNAGWAPRKAAKLLLKIARAVFHVHQQGIIHRDLKPANILIDGDGEPYITDFGLAKHLDSHENLTKEFQVIGTPHYMSPEQARGDLERTGTLTDVYSLGAILFHLIAGQPPHVANGPYEIIKQVIDQDVPLLGQFNPKIDLDIQTICQKCLQKNPEDRIQSAQELADEIQRFLTGLPIRSRSVSRTEYVWRMAKRNPIVSSLILSTSIVLVLATIISTWFSINARHQKKSAEKQSRLAKDRQIDAENSRVQEGLRMLRMYRKKVNDWTAKAMDLLGNLQLASDEYYRFQYVTTMVGQDARPVRGFGQGYGTAIQFSPDGGKLAFSGYQSINTSHEGKLWNIKTNEVFKAPPSTVSGPVGFIHGEPVELVVIQSPALQLRRLHDHEVLKEFAIPVDEPVSRNQMQWTLSADGARIAALIRYPTRVDFRVWDVESSRIIHANSSPIDADGEFSPELEKSDAQIALSADGSLLAIGDNNGRVNIWRLDQPALVRQLQFEGDAVFSMTFTFAPGRSSPNNFKIENYYLAIGYSGGTAVIWNVDKEVPVAICRGSHHAIYATCFNADSTVFATGGRTEVNLWDTRTGSRVFTIQNINQQYSMDYVTGLDFSPDGHFLAIAGKNGHDQGDGVHVWEFHSSLPSIQALRGLSGSADKILFSASETLVAAISQSWTLGVWDTRDRKLKRLFDLPQSDFSDSAGLLFSEDENSVLYCNGSQAIEFQIQTGKVAQSWTKLPTGMQNKLRLGSGGEIRLIRFETEDSSIKPFSEAHDRSSNRLVCRHYRLLDGGVSQLISQSELKFLHIRQIVASQHGEFYAVRAVRNRGESERIWLFDSSSGKKLYERVGTVIRRNSLEDNLLVAYLASGNRTLEDCISFETGQVIKKGLPYASASSGQTHARVAPHPTIENTTRVIISNSAGDQLVLGFDATQGSQIKLLTFSGSGKKLAWAGADSRIFVAQLDSLQESLSKVTAQINNPARREFKIMNIQSGLPVE